MSDFKGFREECLDHGRKRTLAKKKAAPKPKVAKPPEVMISVEIPASAVRRAVASSMDSTCDLIEPAVVRKAVKSYVDEGSLLAAIRKKIDADVKAELARSYSDISRAVKGAVAEHIRKMTEAAITPEMLQATIAKIVKPAETK